MQDRKQLSHSRLKELLHYDHETGDFIWKVTPSYNKKVNPGDVGGWIETRGYRRIEIDRRTYSAHRLAWFYMTGKWPMYEIDHINGQRCDNRFCNLREVTSAQNNQNSKSVWGSSKYRGVWWSNSVGKWQSQIKLNGKRFYLGVFDMEEDAANAYKSARLKYHPFAPTEKSL